MPVRDVVDWPYSVCVCGGGGVKCVCACACACVCGGWTSSVCVGGDVK